MAVRAGGDQSSHAVGFSLRSPGGVERFVRAGAGDAECGRFDHPGACDAGRDEDQSPCRRQHLPPQGEAGGSPGIGARASAVDGGRSGRRRADGPAEGGGAAAGGTATPKPFGGRGARSGALAEGEERGSRQFCGACFEHRPGSARDEEWRGRHGAELQRATADRHCPRVDRQCGRYHRGHRSSSTRTGSGALRATLGRLPQQVVADGNYTNHASVEAAAKCGVDFYGSWQESWKAGERDAQGRSGAFLASAFPYDAERDCFTCPAGQTLTHQATQNREYGVRIHMYRAPRKACQGCPMRSQCAPPKALPAWVRSISRLEEPAATRAFKAKMATEAAKQIYAQRSRIAEFPHAWIKERCGLRQFRCRGLLKATLEATWAALSYNLTRWFALKRQPTLDQAALASV
ncbi:MAG: transposase [Terriglobia bacterium]